MFCWRSVLHNEKSHVIGEYRDQHKTRLRTIRVLLERVALNAWNQRNKPSHTAALLRNTSWDQTTAQHTCIHDIIPASLTQNNGTYHIYICIVYVRWTEDSLEELVRDGMPKVWHFGQGQNLSAVDDVSLSISMHIARMPGDVQQNRVG